VLYEVRRQYLVFDKFISLSGKSDATMLKVNTPVDREKS